MWNAQSQPVRNPPTNFPLGAVHGYMVADSAGDDEPVPSGSLPTDTAFELLAHRRRRTALRCLSDHAPSISLADLAEEVAVRETGRSLPDIDPDEVLQVYLSLYHVHIPKLTEAAVIEYVQDRDLVTLPADRTALDRLITLAEHRVPDG